MTTWITNFLTVFSAIIRNEKGSFNPGGEGAGSGGSDGAGSGTSDSNAGDSGSGESGGSGADSSNGQQAAINYPEGLDKDLHGNASFDAFVNSEGNINYADMMKSYVHQKGLLGKDKIVAPNQDTTEEQWKDIHNKLGLPERDKYEVQNNLAEGVQANEDLFKGLVDVAHNNGILPRQLQPMMDFFNNQIGESMKSNTSQHEAKAQEQVQALKTEWGQGYETNLGRADNALKHFASEEQIQALTESGLLQSPELTRLFAKIGEGLQEDDTFHDEAKRTYGMTPDEAQGKLKEFYDVKTALGAAFMSKSHPQNKWAKDEFMKVQKILHGEGDAGKLLNIQR